jgi:hypothetical protein
VRGNSGKIPQRNGTRNLVCKERIGLLSMKAKLCEMLTQEKCDNIGAQLELLYCKP